MQKLEECVEKVVNNRINSEEEKYCDGDEAQKEAKKRAAQLNHYYYLRKKQKETDEMVQKRRTTVKLFLERRKQQETAEEAKKRHEKRAKYLSSYYQKKKEERMKMGGIKKKVNAKQKLLFAFEATPKLEIKKEEKFPPRVYMGRKKKNEEMEIGSANAGESLISSADFDIIRKRYLWCAVPQCRSSSRRNPNKMFVCVPFKSRLKWFQLARINPNQVYIKSRIYFCEDHFNIPNDVANYIENTKLNSVRCFATKKECLPSKFECQKNKPEPASIRQDKKDFSDSENELLTTMKVEPESETWMDENSQSYESDTSNALVSGHIASTSGNTSVTNLNIKIEPPATPPPYDDNLVSSSTIFHIQDTDQAHIKLKTEPSSPPRVSPMPFEFMSSSTNVNIQETDEAPIQIKTEPSSPHQLSPAPFEFIPVNKIKQEPGSELRIMNRQFNLHQSNSRVMSSAFLLQGLKGSMKDANNIIF